MATRLRSTTVVLSATFLATAGCGDSQDTSVDTAQVCVERETFIRADEAQCPPETTGVTGTSGSHVWVWQRGHVPAIGQKVSGFSTVRTGIVGTAPAGGGTAVSSGS